jgi:tRNA threonylcarbamoyladenosine biosynthesis protein TsaE
MAPFIFDSTDEAATNELGALLGELLPEGVVVGLSGTLGAGKTRLVQAIAASLGIDRRDVVSPTFVLVQEYHGRKLLYHLDTFRLRDEEEFLRLGPEEYFESDGIVLVEWADRVSDCLPSERIDIRIEVTGAQLRRFEIAAVGPRFEPVIARLAGLSAGGR